ncbi:hypothetical protein HK099_004297 [Clydaea vesicula]|uniref:N-acetyltransferase domain-containing protein n=1 Tax=Clydaea vesicula TaxID=447962 RepID=A0AAD5U9H0_9FUNG|nr:hypothetical protein HK099_004297 [Clydaea vesicula]
MVIIRDATVKDVKYMIEEIYRPEVLNNTATFDILPPTVKEKELSWFPNDERDEKYPFTVALVENVIAGYCYIGKFKENEAYNITVEISVYIHEKFRRKGIALILLEDMLQKTKSIGYKSVIALICEENVKSNQLFVEKLGFTLRVHLPSVGKKFSRVLGDLKDLPSTPKENLAINEERDIDKSENTQLPQEKFINFASKNVNSTAKDSKLNLVEEETPVTPFKTETVSYLSSPLSTPKHLQLDFEYEKYDEAYNPISQIEEPSQYCNISNSTSINTLSSLANSTQQVEDSLGFTEKNLVLKSPTSHVESNTSITEDKGSDEIRELASTKSSPNLIQNLMNTTHKISNLDDKIDMNPNNSFDNLDGITSTPIFKKVNNIYGVHEFDPLVDNYPPKDWMINFESPNGHNGEQSISFLDGQQIFGDSKQKQPVSQPQQPQPSLIDSYNYASPKSVAKYSERDIEKIKTELSEKFEKEFELLQQELSETQLKQKEVYESKLEIEKTLSSWEITMNRMIAERDNDRLGHKQESEMLKLQIEKLRVEKDRLKSDYELLMGKYKQLRLDNEDLKESEGKLREKSDQLENDLTVSEKRYEALKAHAQEKLNSANVEIHKVRQHFEKEISTLKTNLSRKEILVKSLQQQVEMKNTENFELTKICDGLVLEIEQQNLLAHSSGK